MKTRNFSIFSRIKLIITNQRGNFMGGGDGGVDDGGVGDGGNPGDGGTGIQYTYPDGFDETLKGNPTLLKYADDKGQFNVPKIMKSLVHATGMLGKDKMSLPDETWTDDQYSEMYNKLGRPADIKEYGIKNNLSEGIEENKEFFDNFQQAAYEAGLAPKQAQKMSDFLNSFLGESVSKNNEIMEANYTNELNSLKQEWGDAFDNKTKRAYSALEQFASGDEIADMKKRGLLDNSLITKLFDKVADGMSEDSLKVKGGNTFGLTTEEAAQEIEKYYVKGHPYMTKGHPEQRFYQEKMLKLQRIKLAGRR